MNLQELEQRILFLGEYIYTQENFYQQASSLLSQEYPAESTLLEPQTSSKADRKSHNS